MNPIFCTTIACLQMAFGPSTVRHVGQYTVLQTRTHFHYCRELSPGYSCQSVSVGSNQDSAPGTDGSSRPQRLDLRWDQPVPQA